MISNYIKLLLLTGTAIAACTVKEAHAQSATTGTAAGTTISNTASVSYTVNGTPQTTNSTTASFVVDRKVNFNVAVDQSGTTKVNMGSTGQVLRFKVTNTTNGTQDFLLNAYQTGIIGGLLTGTDDFDMTNVKIYVDSNGNGTYDAGVDTQTFIDELAPDASVEVFIVSDTPATGSINQADFALQVRAAAGGQGGTQGALLLPTDLNLANADNTVDIVFADDDSDALGVDIARNGQGWAYNSYVIGARNVALTVTKTALVLSDGVNTLNPKSLPGAVVQYCLVANNGTLGVAANNVTLSDVVPANTTYVAGSVQSGLPGGTCMLTGTPIADSTAFNSSTKTVSVNLGTLNGGASQAVSFRVTIN